MVVIYVRGSVHPQATTLNVKLIRYVRAVAEMSKTNFENTMNNNSNKK